MRSGRIGRCVGSGLTVAVLMAVMGHLALPLSARGQAKDEAALAKGMSGILVPEPKPVDASELAGVPAGIRLHELTLEQAYTLAIVRARNSTGPLAAAIDPRVLAGPADFARFREQFLARPGADGGGAAFRDPTVSILGVLEQQMRAEIRDRSVQALAQLVSVVMELVKGEASGLEQQDLDPLGSDRERARGERADERLRYRDRLDALRCDLRLSPHAPVLLSAAPIAPFREVFDEIEAWHSNPGRDLNDVPKLVQQLAPLESGVFEFAPGRPTVAAVAADRARLESVLRASEAVAIKNHGGADPDGATALRVRKDVRHFVETHAAYERTKRELVGLVRSKDGAFEALIAPPVAPNRRRPPVPNLRVLVALADDVNVCESRLVSLWASFHARRIALARELGVMPAEDWTSFHASFAVPLRKTTLSSKPR